MTINKTLLTFKLRNEAVNSACERSIDISQIHTAKIRKSDEKKKNFTGIFSRL
jgi:hypothetical protein